MSIIELQDEIVEEFNFFDDWMEKYEYIIDLGKELLPFNEAYKTEENRIKGCQSQLWIHIDNKNGNLHFTADSDAIITKGIAALILRPIEGKSIKEIADYNFDFVDEIGLKEHLSMTRSNGLSSMIERISTFAKHNK